MRVSLGLLGGLFVALPGMAADLPLQAAYGTAAGCALVNPAQGRAGGAATAFAGAELRHRGMICPYVVVEEAESADGAPAWSVIAICADGHDEESAVTFTVTEHRDAGEIRVALVEGEGPEGVFPACP